MGLFQQIFKRPEPVGQNQGTFELLSAYTPRFSGFRDDIYTSDLVRSAIDARARHISKLKIEIMGAGKPTLQTQLRKAPNSWQTWGQFLYRTSTILDVQNNAIIVPVRDSYGAVTGIYPICPSNVELMQYSGKPVLKVMFATGQTAGILLEECGILTKFQSKDDLFGESNFALTELMNLLSIQSQGIEEGIKNSASYRFIATLSNFSTDEDLNKERQRFNATNLRNEGGILLFPNSYKDVKQVNSQPYIPDAQTMAMIEKKVYNYFGVNEEIMQNKAFGDSWSAFYEGAIEPFAIQFSEVITKMLFTPKEIAQGSFIMASANRLQYMSTQDKLQVASQLADRGVLNRDEVRDIFNLPPLPNGDGQEYIIRGEYWNATEKINEGSGVVEQQDDGENQ